MPRFFSHLPKVVFLISFSVLACCSRAPVPVERGATLILEDDVLDPTTTLEVRFDQDVVLPERVGKTGETAPLVLDPAVEGEWVWLSQRSGVFKPSGIWKLGQREILRLKPGLKTAEGKVLDAELVRVLEAPGLEVLYRYPDNEISPNASVFPEYFFHFNAQVQAAQIRKFLEFTDEEGHRVAAEVTQHSSSYPPKEYYQYYSEMRPWDYRGQGAEPAAVEIRNGGGEVEAYEISNAVKVRPARPLAVGKGWKLRVKPGLREKAGVARLAGPYEIAIGDVVDFSLEEVLAHNGINDGKWISIRFNKRLPSLEEPGQFAGWISIQPEPANLKWSTDWSAVGISGDFELGQAYTVTVKKGLPAAEVFELRKERENLVQFAPLPARLYFPGFQEHQYSAGRRSFELLTMNVPSFRLRAKKIGPDNLIHALRACKGYSQPYEQSEDGLEPYGGIDYDLLPGEPVAAQTREGTKGQPVDEAERIALSWDDFLGQKAPGAVFLEVTSAGSGVSPKVGAQALVQVTDLGLLWKHRGTRGTECWVYVFSLETGLPVSGARVRIMNEEGGILSAGTSDAAGMAKLGGLALDSKNQIAYWLMADKGNDVHAEPFLGYQNDLSVYPFDIPTDFWSAPSRSPRFFFFTDRPLYRLGETVHCKGIYRDFEEGRLLLPEGREVSLVCRDPQGRVVQEEDLQLSANGTMDHSFNLPKRGLGHYSIQLSVDGQNVDYHSFSVLEFEPNSFEVKLDHPAEMAADPNAQVGVVGRYLMGKPLSKARVKWSLTANDSGFFPSGFDGYFFGTDMVDSRFGRQGASFATQGEFGLDAEGKGRFQPAFTTNPTAPGPRHYSFLAEVTDLNQQTISTSSDMTVHSSDFYLGVPELETSYGVGDLVPLHVIAVGTDGEPWEQPVRAEVVLYQVDWKTVAYEAAGGAKAYRNEPELKEVKKAGLESSGMRRYGKRWLVEQGNAFQALKLDKPGFYLLEFKTKDAGGRTVVTAKTLNVYGEGNASWDYRNPIRIELIPDKESYRAGDSAKVLVKTPVAGRALVTVEREGVRRSFQIQLKGDSPIVNLPLESGDAPNVMVSVTLLRGLNDSPHTVKQAEFRYGYCMLKVEDPASRLAVAVEAGQESYLPGELAAVTARVTDAKGAGVAGAEVVLYAVDEGVLSLMGYDTPDPWSYFYTLRPLRLQTSISLRSIFSEDPERRDFGNKGFIIGDGGDESLQGVRKDFAPCAFWGAQLKTDKQGRVTAKFKLPDSLTRFRVIAVAVSGTSKFGSTEGSFEVRKPLMLQPALPRFANQEDRLLLRAVVHNLSGKPGRVEVELQPDGTIAADNAKRAPWKQEIDLAAGATGAVDFPAVFVKTGKASWNWRARFVSGGADRGFSDAVASTLEVGYPVPLLREVHVSRTGLQEDNLLRQVNPQLLEGGSAVDVTLTNTRLGEVAGALDYLLKYPYGCVEQTTSSLLPWLVLGDMVGVLPQLKKTPEEMEDAVMKGVDRLFSMQTADGGLSYWPGGQDSMLWGSAYATLALAQAEEQGYDLPEGPWQLLKDYLSAQLTDSAKIKDPSELSTRCLALHALAGAGGAEESYLEVFHEKRELLGTEERALLAMAMAAHDPGDARIEALLKERPPMRGDAFAWFGSPDREHALRLMAWCGWKPEDRQVDVLVNELLDGRKSGHWTTTQGNAWSLLALRAYADAVEKEPRRAAGSLELQGAVRKFVLQEAGDSAREQWWLGGGNSKTPLTLKNPGANLLFTRVAVEGYPKVARQPAQDRGYALARRYEKIADDGTLSPAQELRVGDRILVTLNLEARRVASYLAIEDPLPSIFEPIQPEFKTQQTQAGQALDGDFFCDYREMRKDRVLFFRDHLLPGNYVLRYLARVKAAGTALAPSAKVEEMYHPERFGLSETQEAAARGWEE
jgi:uncharacterized protein YfaS (alpha-2-macroglobulin family)